MKHVVKKLFFVLIAICVGNICGFAQDDFEIGYDYFYSSAHRVKVRQVVTCSKDNQQLWNGDYVRLIKGLPHIYHDSVCITHGYQVWLEHTGHYTISVDNEQRLIDAEGNYTGIHGQELTMLWNGVVCVFQDNYYSLYKTDNTQIGTVLSDKLFELYYNGFYCCHFGTYYYVIDPKGEKVQNAFGVVKPGLSENGLWLCRQETKTIKVDEKGRIRK